MLSFWRFVAEQTLNGQNSTTQMGLPKIDEGIRKMQNHLSHMTDFTIFCAAYD